MGIHINGDHNAVNVVHGDTYYGEPQRPSPPPVGFFSVFFTGLILVGLLIKFWYVALIVASVAAIAYGTWLEMEQKQRAAAAKRAKKAALLARAENQNSAYLRGEQYGMYGQYPPPAGL